MNSSVAVNVTLVDKYNNSLSTLEDPDVLSVRLTSPAGLIPPDVIASVPQQGSYFYLYSLNTYGVFEFNISSHGKPLIIGSPFGKDSISTSFSFVVNPPPVSRAASHVILPWHWRAGIEYTLVAALFAADGERVWLGGQEMEATFVTQGYNVTVPFQPGNASLNATATVVLQKLGIFNVSVQLTGSDEGPVDILLRDGGFSRSVMIEVLPGVRGEDTVAAWNASQTFKAGETQTIILLATDDYGNLVPSTISANWSLVVRNASGAIHSSAVVHNSLTTTLELKQTGIWFVSAEDMTGTYPFLVNGLLALQTLNVTVVPGKTIVCFIDNIDVVTVLLHSRFGRSRNSCRRDQRNRCGREKLHSHHYDIRYVQQQHRSVHSSDTCPH